MSVVAPYPWDRLTHLSRRATAAARRVGRFAATERLPAFEHALGALLGSPVRVVLGQLASASAESTHGIRFETRDGVAIVVDPEPALAAALGAQLLGRPIGLVAPDVRVPAELAGALAALVIEAARDAAVAVELRTRPEPMSRPGDFAFDATLLLDGRPYRLGITVYEQATPTAIQAVPIELPALGTLRIRLSIVAAISAGSRDDVESLRPGDVWFPGEGWLGVRVDGDRRLTTLTRAALGTAIGETGIAIDYLDGTRLVLRGDRVALGVDANGSERGQRMDDSKQTLQALALSAPLVVRVEVGSVTLTATEWARLRPGDVIETGVSLGEPVVLRVAGQDVARGELVNIDGELGVRIVEITSKE